MGSSPAVGSSRNRISGSRASARARAARLTMPPDSSEGNLPPELSGGMVKRRSEEHTSELQSRPHLVCRLLLEKKKRKNKNNTASVPNHTKPCFSTPSLVRP